MEVSGIMIVDRSEQTGNGIEVLLIFLLSEYLLFDNVELDFAVGHSFSTMMLINIWNMKLLYT